MAEISLRIEQLVLDNDNPRKVTDNRIDEIYRELRTLPLDGERRERYYHGKN